MLYNIFYNFSFTYRRPQYLAIRRTAIYKYKCMDNAILSDFPGTIPEKLLKSVGEASLFY